MLIRTTFCLLGGKCQEDVATHSFVDSDVPRTDKHHSSSDSRTGYGDRTTVRRNAVHRLEFLNSVVLPYLTSRLGRERSHYAIFTPIKRISGMTETAPSNPGLALRAGSKGVTHASFPSDHRRAVAPFLVP